MSKGEWVHVLHEPITTPEGTTLTQLKFPRMKGKYMRKYQMRISQGDIERARAGEEVGTSMSFCFDDFMTVGAAMLADEHGPVTASYIIDEMGPQDVQEVVARLGELFAGGRTTGKTS